MVAASLFTPALGAKYKRIMPNKYWLLFWMVGVIAVGVWAASAFFSRDARLERRRRKSHRHVISKENRPTVRFSVRVPKDKRKP